MEVQHPTVEVAELLLALRDTVLEAEHLLGIELNEMLQSIGGVDGVNALPGPANKEADRILN